jgi:hypothetical protein
MKNDDLMKKLENLETPEIELSGHRQVLKMVLLSSGRFKKRTIMYWAKILAPVTAAVLLIAVVGFPNVIQPRLQMAQAKEIAMSDLQVRDLMEENQLEITEVKLQNGEAYVLLGYQAAFFKSDASRNIVPAPGEEESFSASNITVSVCILKVDLAEEKVTGVGEIDEDIELDDIDFVQLAPEAVAPEEADLD